MSTAAAAAARRRHVPGLAHLAVALIVLIVVLLIALHANPANPPLIAEFAPQVQQVIKQAPQGQSASQGGSGHGQGAGTGQGSGPGGGPGGKQGVLADVHCAGGDPPRQIEDPQSPPCVTLSVPPSKNGGSTWQGVTSTTIKIAFPCQCGSGSHSSGYGSAPTQWAKFFNTHFDLYGRSVVFTPYDGSQSATSNQQAIADAVAADGNFASTEYTDTGGWDYHAELAHKGVVSVFGFEANPTEAQLAQFDPYLWSYSMSADNMLTTLGNWYCSELNGGVAQWSPTYSTTQTKRHLGLIYAPWEQAQSTPLGPILNALSRCGVTPYVVNDSAENQTNAVLSLKGANVTSVMCLCDLAYWAVLTDDAAGQAYFPEWLLSSFGGDDDNWAFHFFQPNQEEAANTFGLSFNPRQWALTDDPMWWAWTQGCNCNPGTVDWIDIYQAHLLYRSILELLSGIQMAGPNLTPTSFAHGLQNTAFPDPVAPDPTAALHEGFVDFFNGSHAMTTDAAEWWYSPTADGPYGSYGEGAGTICYVNGGARHTITQWPRAPSPFFQGTCDAGG